MSLESLREEIAIQLELLDATLGELESIRNDVATRAPTVRELAATASFLANYYTGTENILKRIARYYGVVLPQGEDWHAELFNRFCEPGFQNLPVLFNEEQKKAFAAFRRFRHVAYHGYALQLDWGRMAEGVENVDAVYSAFKKRLRELFSV